MNSTNRTMNRLILLSAGMALSCFGIAVVLALVWDPATEIWIRASSVTCEWILDFDAASRSGVPTNASGVYLVSLSVLLLFVLGALFLIARLGGGRSEIVIRDAASDSKNGEVVIRTGFLSQALTGSYASQDSILSSRVSARQIRGRDVLHVKIYARLHSSPLQLAETATEMIDRVLKLAGSTVPACVTIHPGVKPRFFGAGSRLGRFHGG